MTEQDKISEMTCFLIGDSSVGKTSMLKRYKKLDISDFHVATIGIEKYEKQIKIKGSKNEIKFEIIDSSGQERYKAIVNNYYRITDGIILMYDVTNRESFEHLEFWIEDIKEKSKPNIPIYLIGNKTDLDEREIQFEEGKILADKHGYKFIEMSVLLDKKVKEIFEDISQDIYTYKIACQKDNVTHRLDVEIVKKKKNRGNCCNRTGK